MAKTVYLDNYYGLLLGYGVDTTVLSSSWIDGGTYYDENGDLQHYPPIGVQVYPANMTGIAIGTLLDIGGVGPITVSGEGSDDGGLYFTYSTLTLPGAGASVRTPWSWSGPIRFTRANNSVTLTYYMPAVHDLYFRTQETSDSGSISATLDGSSLGTFDLANATTTLADVLLSANVAAGTHTAVVTANIGGSAVFVYFNGFAMLEHDVETGGEYLYLGPAGSLDDSTNNFVGDWSTTAGYAYNTDGSGSVFFYPQLDTGGKIAIRVQKTPDSGIVAVYVNGSFQQNLDLYAYPSVAPVEITLLDTASNDPTGQYTVELRNTGTRNPSSSANFFYFKSAVVYYSRTDTQTLTLVANYLKQVAGIRGDGAFLDSWDSIRINFDANALYACMGLLAAYEALGGPGYLDAVKNFLTWFASMQKSAPGDSFTDGAWNIGYQVNPAGSPAYIPAVAPYDAQGISEIRWVDAVQCLPAFVLWWYWKLSGDNATKTALLPAFTKAIDGFLMNNYDGETGFFFSSWQNKTSPTIFIYHDAIRRYSGSGSLLEQHNDADSFFIYTENWGSYAPQGALNGDEHFTLNSGDSVQFSLSLTAGDLVKWVTQTAWDAGIVNVLVSTNGTNFTQVGTLDSYSPSLLLQQEFFLYSAPATATYWFRIQHSGTINAAGNIAPGWQRLASRFSAGQSDVLLGLTGIWMMTRKLEYATLAVRTIRRFPDKFWNAAEGRWFISIDGAGQGSGNSFWYPMSHGYTPFAQEKSRFFQPPSLFAAGLEALEPYQDDEGGFKPPGYIEAENIFAAFYQIGENQLAAKTDQARFDLANNSLKGGQYFVNIGGQQCGGILFSKRYQYLYTNISGFACMALSGVLNPITEQLMLSMNRTVMPQ